MDTNRPWNGTRQLAQALDEPGVACQSTEECHHCHARDLAAIRSLGEYRVVRCSNCSLQFLSPQPASEVLEAIYSERYFLHEADGVEQKAVSKLKQKTAERYAQLLSNVRDGRSGALLEIGCGGGEFLLAAQNRGFEVAGLEVSSAAAARANACLGTQAVHVGNIEASAFSPRSFDVIALFDVIEHVRNPREVLNAIYDWLRPGGTILLVTPSTDSWSYRLMRRYWMEYKIEHLFYFNRSSMAQMLSEQGFRDIQFFGNAKVLSFEYVRAHFRRFPVRFWSSAVEWAGKITPMALQRRPFVVVASGLTVTATKAP